MNIRLGNCTSKTQFTFCGGRARGAACGPSEEVTVLFPSGWGRPTRGPRCPEAGGAIAPTATPSLHGAAELLAGGPSPARLDLLEPLETRRSRERVGGSLVLCLQHWQYDSVPVALHPNWAEEGKHGREAEE